MHYGKISLWLLAAFLNVSESRAACEYLQHGLNLKMAEYRTYRDRNLARIQDLQQSKAICDQRGAEVSSKAGTMALAESCTAQGEVASLDQTIEALGKDCETKYRELELLQTKLKAAYDKAYDDMKGALDLIDMDPLMPKYCGPEIQVAKQMGKAFEVLEGNIINTLNVATVGTDSYATLKETARQLHVHLAAGNRNCGDGAPAGSVTPNRTIASTYGQGSATVVPIGNSPRPISDISGTKKAIEENARAEALIGK